MVGDKWMAKTSFDIVIVSDFFFSFKLSSHNTYGVISVPKNAYFCIREILIYSENCNLKMYKKIKIISKFLFLWTHYLKLYEIVKPYRRDE